MAQLRCVRNDSLWRRAKQGAIGIGKDHKTYSLTCDHVTMASDGTFYIKANDKYEIIGERKSKHRNEQKNMDIDCFELNKVFGAFFVKNRAYFETRAVYDGCIEDLYGKRVFRSSIFSNHAEGNQANETCSEEGGGRVYSTVASREEHEHLDEANAGHTFLVENRVLAHTDQSNKRRNVFANEGDSGDCVAMERDGNVEIVGIVTGGNFSFEDSKEYPYATCLFFNSGLNALKSHYSIEFEKFLTSGLTIFFKTPEKINPNGFDLCKYLLMLIISLPSPDAQISDIKEQIQYEQRLSKLVDSRSDISSAIFDEDQPVQSCIWRSYRACAHIYSKKIAEAELCLKQASKCVPLVDSFQLRALCKIITYAVWIFGEDHKEEDAKMLLDEGLAYIEENKSNISFPGSCWFYMLYEYSKYYSRAGERQRAVQYARQAIDHCREVDDSNSSQSSRNRLVLAVALYARLSLACGDNFDEVDKDVDESNIAAVRNVVSEIENKFLHSDAVQQCDFLLAKCDLLFRQGDLEAALEMAYKCRHLAIKTKIEKSKIEALERIKGIQSKL